jgi:hypothetical protein
MVAWVVVELQVVWLHIQAFTKDVSRDWIRHCPGWNLNVTSYPVREIHTNISCENISIKMPSHQRIKHSSPYWMHLPKECMCAVFFFRTHQYWLRARVTNFWSHLFFTSSLFLLLCLVFSVLISKSGSYATNGHALKFVSAVCAWK